jgi:hypothetical protein
VLPWSWWIAAHDKDGFGFDFSGNPTMTSALTIRTLLAWNSRHQIDPTAVQPCGERDELVFLIGSRSGFPARARMSSS